ncbi:MAG: hypothetical protein JWP01_2673 [Myxococcales bacterium]|nr:hypothetical protein [Myxococcales bacterium]
MSLTTTAFRIALTAAALCSAATDADARPRRVVILDFDGPRSLADAGRTEVQKILGEQYDVVAKKRWEDARARAQQKSAGPTTWQKASKQSGVDAIIEGWVQDEGRHKLLTVAVREASTGQELDTVSVRLGAKGLSDDGRGKLSEELDGVLAYIEGAPEPAGSSLRVIETRKMIGAKQPRVDLVTTKTRKKLKRVADVDDSDEDGEPTPRKRKLRLDDDAQTAAAAATAEDEAEDTDEPADADEPEAPSRKKARTDKEIAFKDPDVATQENSDLVSLFGATSDEGKIADPTAAHVPVPTPRFRIAGGAFYGSRSLNIVAENQTGPQAYSGVPSKGLELNAAVYPFPSNKLDGGLQGIGFTLAVSKSAGSEVSFDDGETVSEYVINQSAYNAGIHYRHPLASLVTVDGEVSYGSSSYLIPDAPDTFEVPDTSYSYIGAGAHLDLNITERASVGFGAKYFYLLDVGDISSVDWYGPGRASGLGLDANFQIPLPQNLYVRGALSYEKFNISYDGVGQITEDEGVSESNDSTVNGSVNVGIQF